MTDGQLLETEVAKSNIEPNIFSTLQVFLIWSLKLCVGVVTNSSGTCSLSRSLTTSGYKYWTLYVNALIFTAVHFFQDLYATTYIFQPSSCHTCFCQVS